MMSCIEMLFDHNLACREPLLQTLEQMEPEDLVRDQKVGRGSIRNIIVHLMNSERYWMSVLNDSEFHQIAPESLDSIQAIRNIWSKIHEETNEFMKRLQEDQLHHVKSVTWGEQMVSFTVGKALIHIANHETHHRGLLSGLIRQQGLTPPDFDML
ncbi:MAG: DinB family protein [Candidatus Thorarchaeota archaeon]